MSKDGCLDCAYNPGLCDEHDDMPPIHRVFGPQEMNFAQFCKWHGLTHDADVEGHIHAGLRSKPTSKTFARFFSRKLRELQDARDEARSLYRQAIERGELVEPARRTTEEIAGGLPELESTQAAIRILAKRKEKSK